MSISTGRCFWDSGVPEKPGKRMYLTFRNGKSRQQWQSRASQWKANSYTFPKRAWPVRRVQNTHRSLSLGSFRNLHLHSFTSGLCWCPTHEEVRVEGQLNQTRSLTSWTHTHTREWQCFRCVVACEEHISSSPLTALNVSVKPGLNGGMWTALPSAFSRSYKT